MGRGQANYRRVKINRSYTIEEVARLFGIHKNTVRAWNKGGLPTCDRKRPALILGRQLATFLQERRANGKRPCRLGELYCFRCRGPRTPPIGMVEYRPITENLGNLTAICPDCTSSMNQRINRAKLATLRGKMEVAFPLALRRLGENSQPSINSDL